MIETRRVELSVWKDQRKRAKLKRRGWYRIGQIGTEIALIRKTTELKPRKKARPDIWAEFAAHKKERRAYLDRLQGPQ